MLNLWHITTLWHDPVNGFKLMTSMRSALKPIYCIIYYIFTLNIVRPLIHNHQRGVVIKTESLQHVYK